MLLVGVFVILTGSACVSRFYLNIPRQVIPIDFDASMQSDHYSQLLANTHMFNLLQVFKKVYNHHKSALEKELTDNRIPHILHIVWLGSKLPKEYEQFYQSWHKHHTTWTHIFWTDHPANYELGSVLCKTFDELDNAIKNNGTCAMKIVVDTEQLQFDNKKFFNCSRNYGERSDILKWEIVYRYGGTYVDTDFECLNALDQLNSCFDFYTGLQPLDTNQVQLGAALFAAIAHHPIMKACVDGIKNNQHIVPIVAKSGPLHFTKCFLEKATEHNLINIALPAGYFYPCGYEERNLAPAKWMKNEALAVHHWAGSWIKTEGFVRS